MDYFNDVLDGPDKLEAYYDDPEMEMFNMPELEEMETLEDESHEDSPRPTRKNPRRSARTKKKKRKRSSSAESLQECDEEEKVVPMSKTNKEINVGDEYQAVVPDDVTMDYPEDKKDTAEKIWETPENINENHLDWFVQQANDRYRVPIDQALFILTKNRYNFKKAIDSIAKREGLRDVWSDEEVNLFTNCFFNFGKNFKRIRSAMPHRSQTSMVQYYYDSKKKINYKIFADFKPNESSSSEKSEEIFPYPAKVFEDMCENCGERCEKMEIVEKTNSTIGRTECRACRIYYEIMDVPRPTSLRIVLNERLKSHFNIPDYMKDFMKDYEVLTNEAKGETYAKRFMGETQTLEDIVGITYKANGDGERKIEPRAESSRTTFDKLLNKKEIKEEVKEEDLVDEPLDTATSALPQEPINKNLIPQIWKKKHTICMEEIEVIGEDARRRMFEAVVSHSNVNKKDIANWRNELSSIRHRMERMNRDGDLAPSYVKKERQKPTTEWSEKETDDAFRLFRWYGSHCTTIADIIGNKSNEQVRSLYAENEKSS